MPNRFIKESIWTSRNLNRLPEEAEILFYRLLPLPDDHGCFPADPYELKGRLFPFKHNWTPDKICQQLISLVSSRIISLWVENERLYGLFLKWADHQQIRSLHKRKTPEPDYNQLNSKEVLEYLNLFAVNCNQLISDDSLIPIHIPIHIPVPIHNPIPVPVPVPIHEDKKAKRRKEKEGTPTSAPEFLEPNEKTLKALQEKGFDKIQGAEQIANCLDWHRARGNLYVDWQSVCRTWIRKTFNQPQSVNGYDKFIGDLK